MKIAIAQVNTIIGDIEYNKALILKYINNAKEKGCDIVCFPELTITGYPPCDLLYNPRFKKCCEDALDDIAKKVHGIDVLLGTAIPENQSGRLMNCVVFLRDNSLYGIFPKTNLCRYVYFDEERYFIEGNIPVYITEYKGIKMGIIIGEIEEQSLLGNIPAQCEIDIILNICAIPYYYGREIERIEQLTDLAKSVKKPIVFVNMVGGNNELVFDGGSLVINAKGEVCGKAPSFEETLLIWNIDDVGNMDIEKEDISYLYKGLVLGLRDYCNKSRLDGVVLGLSGGVDSALAACIATEAVGNKNVLAISNPSMYTSQSSSNDAYRLADNLHIDYRCIPIDTLFTSYLKIFNEDGSPMGDIAEENIQARIRGNLWMFISNREGKLLISASNKSELYVGYTTMYGDMCGGLAILSDIYKGQVYELCQFINRKAEIIPRSIITKPPSAELSPDQRDEDSLPPYSILDKVLYMYLENGLFEKEIIDMGYDKDMVYNIINMVNKSEYKRYQAALPIRVSKGWFKRARCMPIVHGFR